LRRTRLSFVATLAVASSAALVGVPAVADAAPKPKSDVAVQLIAMNDFHGRISLTVDGDSQQITEPGLDGAYGTGDDVVKTVGGSANVAATVQRLQGEFAAANGGSTASWFVGAGDLISASPFESSVFKDEPTIEVLDAMGLDVSSVGNHEFDRGTEELRRISAATDGTFTDDVTACEGVTVGVDGCFGEGEHAFDGADFPYLAANVLDKATGRPMLPPYQVFDIAGGRKIALIGVVTETTPSIVTPTGVTDVTFIDEAEAVNRYVPELTRRGVEAIGVLVHEGGEQTGANKANPNGCDALTGPIQDINDRISDEVDLIVSAHTHAAYDCLLDVPGGQDRLVTSAGFYGRLVSDIRLTLDARTGEVNRAATYAATNVPVLRTAADPTVQSIVDYWNARSADARNRHVGFAESTMLRGDRTTETSLANLVAESYLAALQKPELGSPVVGIVNPGALRADLVAGEVLYGEVYAIQPFGNTVDAVTLTGADLDLVLEQQYQPRGQRSALALGTSKSLTWSYDLTRAFGDRVSAVAIDGTPIDPAAKYRVATNSFLTAGGDDFVAFKNGTGQQIGALDVDALEAYIAANSPVVAPAADHGTRLG
jgi:5'-nucleotidase